MFPPRLREAQHIGLVVAGVAHQRVALLRLVVPVVVVPVAVGARGLEPLER